MTGQLNVLLEKEVSVLNDKKIISAIIKRDEQILAYIVQKYSKLLWKIAASILINAASVQDVEECIADVFIYLWQYPEKYNPDKAKLSSWLSILTRSKAIDRYRQIIRRFYYEQKPAEIAVALDISKKQVENKLYYVKQKLKKMMEK